MGVGRWGDSGGGKMETTVLEQQFKKKERERTHGYGQQGGDCLGKGSIRGLNGNGKNVIKIISLKKRK